MPGEWFTGSPGAKPYVLFPEVGAWNSPKILLKEMKDPKPHENAEDRIGAQSGKETGCEFWE